MRIGLSCGYLELYWGPWFQAKQLGGSERIVIELAKALTRMGHDTTIRLPYEGSGAHDGVQLIPFSANAHDFDLLFAFDDFDVRDTADRTCLVACRSDPPKHVAFDQMIFLSPHHSRLMGYPDRPSVGGGVDLADYADPLPRAPRRVICTSSPDRCALAPKIGAFFDFVHTYKPVLGVGQEFDRSDLLRIQKQAMAQIYPLAPSRPSDFFSMSVLEAHAAGTPVVVSDRDSMLELWGDSALVLPGPIRIGEWVEATGSLLTDKGKWRRYSDLGRARAAELTWDKQAARYLAHVLEN